MWGMKSSPCHRGRTAGVRSVSRPSPGRSATTRMRRVEMWRGGGRSNISVAAPHMGVIRSRGFVPSFSPFVSDPKSEPSVIRPGLPVLVSTSHTVAARRRSYQYPAYGRAGAQEDETNLSFGLSRPEGGAVVHLDLLGLINPSRLQN